MRRSTNRHSVGRNRLGWPHTCALGLLATGAIVAPAVGAETTLTDVQIAVRTLSFMEKPMSGNVRIGLVYERGSPASARQAEALNGQLAGGLKVGGISLTPVIVAIDEVALAAVDLFLLTEHISLGVTEVAEASKSRRIPCITTDVSHVESGGCTMAVRSRPKVEVIVNRAAANDGGIKFATAFRVMITEI